MQSNHYHHHNHQWTLSSLCSFLFLIFRIFFFKLSENKPCDALKHTFCLFYIWQLPNTLKGHGIISSAEQIFLNAISRSLALRGHVSSYITNLTKVKDEKLQWVKWFKGRQMNKKIREAECQGKEAWRGQIGGLAVPNHPCYVWCFFALMSDAGYMPASM